MNMAINVVTPRPMLSGNKAHLHMSNSLIFLEGLEHTNLKTLPLAFWSNIVHNIPGTSDTASTRMPNLFLATYIKYVLIMVEESCIFRDG